jgi:site-specific DNA-methyltransferase (adenine-specific)
MNIAENRDCMEVMASLPDKAYDLAIVDPPYGIDIAVSGAIGGTRKGVNPKWRNESVRQFVPKEWDSRKPDASYFAELMRVSRDQIIWGGNYFTKHLPPTNAWIFWDKMPNAATLTFSDGELAWTSLQKPLKRIPIPWLGFGSVNLNEEKTHPAQKPVALYKWLLTHYAKPGDKILDTHLGSGSSRIAAYDLGFDFYGCELDKDYFDAQEQRFANHIAQPKLWEPEPVHQQAMFAEAA